MDCKKVFTYHISDSHWVQGSRDDILEAILPATWPTTPEGYQAAYLKLLRLHNAGVLNEEEFLELRREARKNLK